LGLYDISLQTISETNIPLKVLLTSEHDHGFTLVTGHHKAGEYFIGNMSAFYNDSGKDTHLGAHCDKIPTKDTKDGRYYIC
jgi:hypothetical protein